MKSVKAICFLFLLQPVFTQYAYAQLKYIVYDFDGLDIGQTDLPEGDYSIFDMQSIISVNPLGQSPMLGDRVLKLNMAWSQDKARFGKGISRFIELDASSDYFNFYIYNPPGNISDASITITITEDDNGNNTSENTADDRWKSTLAVDRAPSWQLISLPLNSFTDDNTGGNGIFDAAFTNQAGKVFNIEFNFFKTSANETNSLIYIDMICFSEGILPTGSTILNSPASDVTDHCSLGAYSSNANASNTPAYIEGLFPASASKKLKYVNRFLSFADNGTTTPHKLPGNEISALLQNGYTPIITWEAKFSHLPPLDPAQPKLNDFINGQFDNYINSFADKLQSYNDTIIIRFMHEFEGNWYPWSIVHNNQDPDIFINVFRKVVGMVRARGATKVKWMWCPNGPNYYPVSAYNWMVSAYPGDAYVDIVAFEAYNLPIAGIPYWRSFRASVAEPYYYARKYFPQKMLFICENGCRERYSEEDASSQTKAQWIETMDRELQSNFSKVRALIFFDAHKVQDYRLNSSQSTLNAVEAHIWNDNYYFENSLTKQENILNDNASELTIYPNPNSGSFTITLKRKTKVNAKVKILVINNLGQTVFEKTFISLNENIEENIELNKSISPGAYTLQLVLGDIVDSKRIILSK